MNGKIALMVLLSQGLFIGLSLLSNNQADAAPNGKGVTIKRTEYKGWKDALVISNGKVEAVVVPAVGRIMQFRFTGEDEVFWENPTLSGKTADPKSLQWFNFGGDKTWPAEQADWPSLIKRGWPPPATFDSVPLTAREEGSTIELVSPVDPAYGIRTRRVIKLDPERPVMTVTTTYEKVEGQPVKVAVWIITQMRDPEALFVPVPEKTKFKEGFDRQSKDLPAGLRQEGGVLSMTRDSKIPSKIGSDGSTLLWVGAKHILRIDTPRNADAEYPDHGSSVEVYTSADPLPYIELETLAPVRMMKQGDRADQVNTYTLFRRSGQPVAIDARKALEK